MEEAYKITAIETINVMYVVLTFFYIEILQISIFFNPHLLNMRFEIEGYSLDKKTIFYYINNKINHIIIRLIHKKKTLTKGYETPKMSQHTIIIKVPKIQKPEQQSN